MTCVSKKCTFSFIPEPVHEWLWKLGSSEEKTGTHLKWFNVWILKHGSFKLWRKYSVTKWIIDFCNKLEDFLGNYSVWKNSRCLHIVYYLHNIPRLTKLYIHRKVLLEVRGQAEGMNVVLSRQHEDLNEVLVSKASHRKENCIEVDTHIHTHPCKGVKSESVDFPNADLLVLIMCGLDASR